MPNFRQPTGDGTDGIVGAFKKLGIAIEFTHIASAQTVKFMGVLTNWKDDYQVTWNEEDVYGRMDPIATYQGTRRQITIAWTILSEDDKVGRANLRDISKFINFLYPKYSTTAGRASGLTASSISASPLLKLKFMNLVTNADNGGGLIGYINGNISITPDMDAGFLIPDTGQMIPKAINMEITFSALHSHGLGFDEGDRVLNSGKFPYGATAFDPPEISTGAGTPAKRKKKKGSWISGMPGDPGTGPIRGFIETAAAGSVTVERGKGGDKVPPAVTQGQTSKITDPSSEWLNDKFNQ